jgi:hypothetical protein
MFGIKTLKMQRLSLARPLRPLIKKPQWIELDKSGKSSVLSRTRNELIHEAKFAGQPIGYTYPEENFDFEFVRFNAKLIPAIFGLRSPFLQADPTDRNTRAWSFS